MILNSKDIVKSIKDPDNNFKRVFNHKCLNVPPTLSSGSKILLTITFELRINFTKYLKELLVNVLINISPAFFFQFSFSMKDLIKIVRLLLAAVSINGLMD